MMAWACSPERCKRAYTRYEYDKLNRLIAVINPLFEATYYSYDGNGNRMTVQYPNGNTVIATYDALNRVEKLHRPIRHIGIMAMTQTINSPKAMASAAPPAININMMHLTGLNMNMTLLVMLTIMNMISATT